jgi:hypothetical protein
VYQFYVILSGNDLYNCVCCQSFTTLCFIYDFGNQLVRAYIFHPAISYHLFSGHVSAFAMSILWQEPVLNSYLK